MVVFNGKVLITVKALNDGITASAPPTCDRKPISLDFEVLSLAADGPEPDVGFEFSEIFRKKKGW